MKKVNIYTDGACSGNPGPGGFGTVILFNGVEKEISGAYRATTNNRMELTAAIVGLSALNEPCIVELCSDSKYLVDAINKKWVFAWEKKNFFVNPREKRPNEDLWMKILELIKIHQVTFVWVRGHNGNPNNERCDVLAVNAIKSGNFIE